MSSCDVAGASAIKSSEIQAQIQIAVAVKQQQAAKQTGETAVALIEAAAKIVVDNGRAFDGQG